MAHPSRSLVRYLAGHRRPRQVLAATAAFIPLAAFALMAVVLPRAGGLRNDLAWAALGGAMLGQWMGRRLRESLLPGSRMCWAVLLSISLILWAAASARPVVTVICTAAAYALIFWFSRAAEELLRQSTAARMRTRAFVLHSAIFVGGLAGGILGAVLLMSARPADTIWAARAALVLLAGVWAAMMVTRYRQAPTHPALWATHLLLRFVARCYHDACRVGRCTLPTNGGAVLAATHVSGIDPLVLQAACQRRLRWMIAREYYEIRGLGWVYRLAGCIPVNRDGRDAAATRAAIRRLRAGEVITIFPAGRINLPGEPPPDLKEGAAVLALLAGVPIVPARITGLSHRGVAADWLRPHRGVRVEFGPPIDVSDLSGPGRDAAAEATARLAAALHGSR